MPFGSLCESHLLSPTISRSPQLPGTDLLQVTDLCCPFLAYRALLVQLPALLLHSEGSHSCVLCTVVSSSARGTAWDKGHGQHILEERSMLWRGWVRLSVSLGPLLPSPSESVGAVAVGGCQEAKDRAGVLIFQEKSGIQVLK